MVTVCDMSFLPRVLPSSTTNAALPTGRATLGCGGLASFKTAQKHDPTNLPYPQRWAPSLGGSF